MDDTPSLKTHLLLFLCSGNYYRSRYAELYFHARIPPESGWLVESRGLLLSPGNVGPIAPTVLERLRMRGIPLPAVIRPPLQITREEVRRADIIIALDEDEHRLMVENMIPEVSGLAVYWHVPDVERLSPGEAFPLIERQVEELIRTLTNTNSPPLE